MSAAHDILPQSCIDEDYNAHEEEAAADQADSKCGGAMSESTPGPWWTDEANAEKTHLVADVRGLKVWGPPGPSSPEADALLIRHVPDMIDTLERLVAILNGERPWKDLPLVFLTAQMTVAIARGKITDRPTLPAGLTESDSVVGKQGA